LLLLYYSVLNVINRFARELTSFERNVQLPGGLFACEWLHSQLLGYASRCWFTSV